MVCGEQVISKQVTTTEPLISSMFLYVEYSDGRPPVGHAPLKTNVYCTAGAARFLC